MKLDTHAGSSPSLPYYPHVDGLRALAVISVVLFHLDFTFISGGFIGVDIFFVISGFLITSHIRSAMAAERFSFLNFYTRRARRLLPALMATLLVTLAASYFILPAANFERLGIETLFATFSASNFLFWWQSGYFDATSTLKPLLHTWSLSVEEQFYLFWPLLLFLCKRESHAFRLLLLMGVVSLVASQLLVKDAPGLAFYMMPFRIVEFSIGGILFWVGQERFLNSGNQRWVLRELLALAGLGMILYPVFYYDHQTVFPGVTALLPCLGTALIILTGARAGVVAWLRWPPVLYIGLISYSLYLVHWPLIVLYKYYQATALDKTDQWVLMLATLVLAIVLYHLIESPLRRPRRQSLATPRVFFICLGATTLLLLVISLSAIKFEGWPSRFPIEQLTAQQIAAGKEERFSLIKKLCEKRGWKHCREPSAERERNVLVMGDSHSIDGMNVLYQAYPDFYYTSISLGGCPPLVDEDLVILSKSWPDRDACAELNQKRLSEEFLRDYSVIVISVYFNAFGPEQLLRTIDHIQQKTDAPIVVFGNYIVLNQDMADLHNRGIDPRYHPKVVDSFAAYETALAEQAADSYTYISKQKLLCPAATIEGCRVYFDDIPFSYDQHHLSLAATGFIAQQLVQSSLLRPLLATEPQ